MSHNFKPGDLALIVGAFLLQENIGQAVELVQFLAPEERYKTPDGIGCVAPGYCWVVTGAGVVGAYQDPFFGDVVRTVGHGVCAPEHLMPLRGDFIPDEQIAREYTAC